MSSISSTFAAQSFSPLSRLQDELSSEVSSGTISSSDQNALSSALTDIDSQLKSQMQSAGGRQPPSPADMQSKINDLIAGEVTNGKLTSTQADELKKVFANAFQQGPGGAGGPPPGGPPPGAGGVGSDESGASNAANSTSSDVSQMLQDFLKLVQGLERLVLVQLRHGRQQPNRANSVAPQSTIRPKPRARYPRLHGRGMGCGDTISAAHAVEKGRCPWGPTHLVLARQALVPRRKPGADGLRQVCGRDRTRPSRQSDCRAASFEIVLAADTFGNKKLAQYRRPALSGHR